MSSGLFYQNGKDEKGQDQLSYVESEDIKVFGLDYLFSNFQPIYREEVINNTKEESIYFGPENGQGVRIILINDVNS